MFSGSVFKIIFIFSVFMTPEAQTAIKATFQDAGVANIQNIRPPLSVTAGESRLSTGDLYAEGPWLALIALAGIIVLFCIIGIIVICFTWARYKLLLYFTLIYFTVLITTPQMIHSNTLWATFICKIMLKSDLVLQIV